MRKLEFLVVVTMGQMHSTPSIELIFFISIFLHYWDRWNGASRSR